MKSEFWEWQSEQQQPEQRQQCLSGGDLAQSEVPDHLTDEKVSPFVCVDEGQYLLIPPWHISYQDVYEAWLSCRRRKRHSKGCVEFELELEENIDRLKDELNYGTYRLSPASVFIVDKPVKREIFASAFLDRVVQHLLYNMVGDCLEKHMIYDSYACRKNKGTLFGINRIVTFSEVALEITPRQHGT